LGVKSVLSYKTRVIFVYLVIILLLWRFNKKMAAKKTTKTAKKTKKASPKSKKGADSVKKEIRIVNIVVNTSLDHDIPLEKMAATLPNTEYNPEQFPGLVIRIKDPKTSALIFSSGNVVCTGARTLHDVDESLKKIIKALTKINIKITIKPVITVQNIVASGSIGMMLNLNVLAMRLNNIEYEPEQFPGLVYKLMTQDVKATFLLFSNGKIVCTGTKSEEEVHKALDKLIVNLKKVKTR
tara:strand:- start:5089 stop:5805 length:717 start_codon:yes stop_codon:yes gene_type:complete